MLGSAHNVPHDQPHLVHPYPTAGSATTQTGPSILLGKWEARAFILKSSTTQMLPQDIFSSRASQNLPTTARYR